jgi:3-oxoacyl-[acyl-carrier protein] reductase
MTADVRSSGELNALVTEAVGRFGAVRAVVNNAAVRRSGTASDTSEADWDLTVDTNLKGQFLLAKATIPFMVRGGGGAMVNISSVSAFGGGAHVAYAASKAGVLALTRSMAFDHARHGVRVNAIVAGFIDTPMTAALRTERPDVVKALKRTNAARRVLTPVDYAAVVSFLLSDDADLITGAALEVGLIPGTFPDDSYLYPRTTAS